MEEVIEDMKEIASEMPWKGIFISAGIILVVELIAIAILLITL